VETSVEEARKLESAARNPEYLWECQQELDEMRHNLARAEQRRPKISTPESAQRLWDLRVAIGDESSKVNYLLRRPEHPQECRIYLQELQIKAANTQHLGQTEELKDLLAKEQKMINHLAFLGSSRASSLSKGFVPLSARQKVVYL
jgi:hypothetical protein